jgi:tetratricopeptide (TPR) repeat protein
VAWLFVVWLGLAVAAQEEGASTSTAAALEEVRQDLAALRFEKALSSIEALIADPRLTHEDRIAALILRSQAHVSYGDLDGAEDDYREILLLRPAYAPEESLTPPKAMARYTRVRDSVVGAVVLTVVPPDAAVLVDGLEVVVPADGMLRLLAGSRVLRAQRPGFDPEEHALEIAAGATVPLRLQLMPNARTVVIRTRPEGVQVTVDGVSAGLTAPPEGSSARGLGELTLENLALGEHSFGLAKRCYRDVAYEEIVTVDLSDYSPKVCDPVVLEPARSRLVLRGVPDGAAVQIDGAPVASGPVEDLQVCPGESTLDVVARGRTLGRSKESFPLEGVRDVEIEPRPNVVLVGAADWPPGLRAFASGVNDLGRVEPGRSDLTDPESWKRIPLPPDADVAVAILPPVSERAGERWLLYSPLLGTAHVVDDVDLALPRPSWSETSLGIQLVDSDLWGPALVAVVAADGPGTAVHPGDRIVAVGSQAIRGAAEARALIAALPTTGPVALQIESAGGERRTIELTGVDSPVLLPPGRRAGAAGAWIAAWASADGAAGVPARRPAALANLALMLEDAGRSAAALETWRRVRWGARTGIGDGTTAYYTGRVLEALARENDAVEAYRTAGRSASTTFNDLGPAVAPAADDHLADLGVATERGARSSAPPVTGR